MSDRATALLERAAEAAKTARTIAQKAADESREMTDAERGEFSAKAAEAVDFKAQADVVKKDNETFEAMKSFADLVGLPGSAKDDIGNGPGPADYRVKAKSLGLQVVDSAEYKALMGSFPDGRIPDRASVKSNPIAVKALLVGNDSTSGGAFVVNERTDIVEMLGRRTLTLRDVISVRRTMSDAVEYVRQVSHTNAAAPVAEATSAAAPTTGASSGAALTLNAGGGYKPEGSWTFEVKTETVKTIAEWVPVTRRALADIAQLEGLINDELKADLLEAEETQIVSGSGTGENLTGIMNTSGVQTQVFSTDIFSTIRKAITKARTIGRVLPNGIGLNPADVETIDLAKATGSGEFFSGGPFSMGPRTVWGVPIVESEAFTAGTALVGDFKKAVLWDREQATISISDSHADFFIRNLLAVLGEERVAFGVTRPLAFVKAALA